MKSIKVIFIIIIMILGSTLYGQVSIKTIPFKDWDGKSFPLQDWGTLNGDTLKQDFFEGKVCFFNFFAAGCPPCMREIKYLNKLSNNYLENMDVCVVSFFCGSKDEFQKFYKSQEYTTKASPNSTLELNYSLVPVPKYTVIPIDSYLFRDRYHAWGVPSNLIINKQGIVKYCRSGFPMEKEAQENLYSEYLSIIDKLRLNN